MSCEWVFYCKKCDEEAGDGEINEAGKLKLIGLIEHREEIVKAIILLENLPVYSVELYVSYLRFLCSHEGHELTLRNEYGLTIAEDDARQKSLLQ